MTDIDAVSPWRNWRIRSGAIDTIVKSADQFAAWNTLRAMPSEHFGLIVTAEPDEDGDPIPIRTSRLMFTWGRDDEALAFCDTAIAQGLPDTREVDSDGRYE